MMDSLLYHEKLYFVVFDNWFAKIFLYDYDSRACLHIAMLEQSNSFILISCFKISCKNLPLNQVLTFVLQQKCYLTTQTLRQNNQHNYYQLEWLNKCSTLNGFYTHIKHMCVLQQNGRSTERRKCKLFCTLLKNFNPLLIMA